MSTYVPIQAITLTSNTTSIQFTGIPQTYTDLVIVCSIRDTASGTQTYPWIRFNGDSATNYSFTRMHGNGSSAVSGRASNQDRLEFCEAPGAGSTANYFAPMTIQIMNYANTTTNKTTLVRTNNVGGAVQTGALACLYRSTSAITSILINGQTQIASGSTFTLYGVGSGAPKAFGGDRVVTDGTYWYHTFLSSGRFEPVQNLSNVDYLVVAGGGGGGGGHGGGGGAGGLRSTVTATGGGGSLESRISLSANTGYTITVGAGGAGGIAGTSGLIGGQVGSNSSISGTGITTITSNGGGGGGGYPSAASSQGGSGGGGAGSFGETAGSASNATGQGYSGGTGTDNGNAGNGAGGGGAGQAGANATGGENTGGGGKGGDGVQITALATPTNTGANSGYYAGGGGGGVWGTGATPAAGGLGGGGGSGQGGQSGGRQGVAGTVNTGGGSGGGSDFNPGTTAGGSGIVIIRYAV